MAHVPVQHGTPLQSSPASDFSPNFNGRLLAKRSFPNRSDGARNLDHSGGAASIEQSQVVGQPTGEQDHLIIK